MGFVISDKEAEAIGLGHRPSDHPVVFRYFNGRDIAAKPRGVYIIDLHGLTAEEARTRYPRIYQHVLERVKPERDKNNEKYRRENWWLFGRKNTEMRQAIEGLERFVVSVKTAKHRFFTFADGDVRPDSKLIVVASDDAGLMGTLSSRAHCRWALALGGFLGAGNDPTYVKSRCFETFPFPEPDEATAKRIVDLAEQLDAHRKRQQAQHPGLTMTDMYNVLEKLRRQALPGSTEPPLTAKGKEIHEQGLVSVLRELHDELDRAVFAAYGWDDLADKLVGRPGATTPWPEKPEDQLEAEEELLQRLVDLNHQRAAEEAQGKIRWLRPDYQAPYETPEQTKLDTNTDAEATSRHPGPDPGPSKKLAWPKTLQAQIRAVRDQLATTPMDAPTLAAQFKRKPEKSVTQVLDALAELGMVKQDEAGGFRIREN